MPKEKKTGSSSQTWATFLKDQASDIWACDFTVVTDWLFRQWYVFVVMELNTRRIMHTGVTKYPTDEWTAQKLREAMPWGKELKTPYQTPQANGVCERFMGSLRRESMDHILIHDDKHLRRVVTEFTAYFNQERPHQGIGQRIPNQYDLTRSKPTRGQVTSKAILGGLHHSYSRATYLN